MISGPKGPASSSYNHSTTILNQLRSSGHACTSGPVHLLSHSWRTPRYSQTALEYIIAIPKWSTAPCSSPSPITQQPCLSNDCWVSVGFSMEASLLQQWAEVYLNREEVCLVCLFVWGLYAAHSNSRTLQTWSKLQWFYRRSLGEGNNRCRNMLNNVLIPPFQCSADMYYPVKQNDILGIFGGFPWNFAQMSTVTQRTA